MSCDPSSDRVNRAGFLRRGHASEVASASTRTKAPHVTSLYGQARRRSCACRPIFTQLLRRHRRGTPAKTKIDPHFMLKQAQAQATAREVLFSKWIVKPVR